MKVQDIIHISIQDGRKPSSYMRKTVGQVDDQIITLEDFIYGWFEIESPLNIINCNCCKKTKLIVQKLAPSTTALGLITNVYR